MAAHEPQAIGLGGCYSQVDLQPFCLHDMELSQKPLQLKPLDHRHPDHHHGVRHALQYLFDTGPGLGIVGA